QRAPHHEQHAWPGHHDDDERREREADQVLCGDHRTASSVRADMTALMVPFNQPDAADGRARSRTAPGKRDFAELAVILVTRAGRGPAARRPVTSRRPVT